MWDQQPHTPAGKALILCDDQLTILVHHHDDEEEGDDDDGGGGGEHDYDSNDDDDGEEVSKTESQICFKHQLSSMSALI